MFTVFFVFFERKNFWIAGLNEIVNAHNVVGHLKYVKVMGLMHGLCLVQDENHESAIQKEEQHVEVSDYDSD